MNNVTVTEVTFLPVKPNEKGFIGVSSVLFNHSIVLQSISIYIRPDGSLRLLFPSKILPNGKEVNLFYPISRQVYEAIRGAVVDKYKEITKNINVS